MMHRLPTKGDRERIRGGLIAALNLSLAPEGLSSSTVSYCCTDVDFAVERIIQGHVQAVVVDEAYLVVYAIVNPWYSPNVWVLCEELVLRIGEGSNFSAVVNTLENLAELHDCDIISVGGALARNSKAITRMYRMHGFVLEGAPQLTKRRR